MVAGVCAKVAPRQFLQRGEILVIYKTRYLAFALAVAASATGCISLPQTESSMRSQAPLRNTFTVGQPLEESFDVLMANLDRCYGVNIVGFGRISTVAMGRMTGPDTATVQMRSDGSGGGGIGQLFDLRRTPASGTEITAYYLSIAGKNIRQIAPGWFSGSRRCE